MELLHRDTRLEQQYCILHTRAQFSLQSLIVTLEVSFVYSQLDYENVKAKQCRECLVPLLSWAIARLAHLAAFTLITLLGQDIWFFYFTSLIVKTIVRNGS